MNTVPILDCMRQGCGNALTMKEIKAGMTYCTPCDKIIKDAIHQEALSNQIYRANRVFK